MEHTGRTNCIRIGPKTWGNRTKIWVPDIQNWDGKWDTGHDFNPYWASIDHYNGPVQKIPRGLKVMLKASHAARDGKKPEFVFRAEGMKEESGFYRYLRVTLVFPRYYDSAQDVTNVFNPDWWRWALPAGEDGSGRWKFAYLPDVLGDFTLIEPVKVSTLSDNWTTRTQQLLAALGVDDGGRGYHAEMLPDFSTREDFPTLPDAQEVFAHLGGLMKSNGTGMKWAKGTPVEDQANDKESIAENVVIQVVDQAAFDKLVQVQTPYPRPIMVTSPNNQPQDGPPPIAPAPTLMLIAEKQNGQPGDIIQVKAIAEHHLYLNWTFITPAGQEQFLQVEDTQYDVSLDQQGMYTVVCEAVNNSGRQEESVQIECKISIQPPQSELEERVDALEEDMSSLESAINALEARMAKAGLIMANLEE